MAKPTTSRSSRRRIAGERTAHRQGQRRPGQVETTDVPPQPPEPATVSPRAGAPRPKLSLVPPTADLADTGADVTSETSDTEKPASGGDSSRPRPARRGPSNPVLSVLAVLAAAVVAAAAYFAVPAWHARAVDQAQATAPSVAERAAKAILSYDYRSLDHDEKTAAGYLTPAYRKKYENTFSFVKAHAPALQAQVTAQVLGSGISEADADHAHVLLFVNQTTKSRANPGQPQIALNRVMLDMVRQGGTWLVNGISSY